MAKKDPQKSSMKLAVQSSGNKGNNMIAGIKMFHEQTRKWNMHRASEMNISLSETHSVFLYALNR